LVIKRGGAYKEEKFRSSFGERRVFRDFLNGGEVFSPEWGAPIWDPCARECSLPPKGGGFPKWGQFWRGIFGVKFPKVILCGKRGCKKSL